VNTGSAAAGHGCSETAEETWTSWSSVAGTPVGAWRKQFLARVTATTRNPERLADLGAAIICTEDLSAHVRPGMLILHSIPPDAPADLLEPLRGKAARVVYLSSTAVYGSASRVGETTVPEPGTPLAQACLDAELTIAEGPWSSLILRPAAIYGPGRGIHQSIQRGEYSLSNTFVSRIHVDDLAAHAEAALLSAVTGAWPVADEEHWNPVPRVKSRSFARAC